MSYFYSKFAKIAQIPLPPAAGICPQHPASGGWELRLRRSMAFDDPQTLVNPLPHWEFLAMPLIDGVYNLPN